jgi:hypothetical protein
MSPETPRKRRGCCFYGCLGSAILFVVAVIALTLFVRHYLSWAVANFSDAQPASLPKVEAAPGETKALQDRFLAFKTALETGQPTPPLELDEQALNLLLASLPELQAFKDKVHVSLSADQIKGEVSLPLDQLPLVDAIGRYLNGAATFKVSLKNGVLIVTLDSLAVKGQPLPDEIMAGLRQQNLARDVYQDPRTAEAMRKLESITVQDGRITIRAAAATPEAPR